MKTLAHYAVILMADGLLIPIVLLGGWAMYKLPVKVRNHAYLWAIGTGLTAYAIAKTLGMFYKTERPFVANGVAPGASYLKNGGFPSDHALLVFTITLVVWASTKNVKLSLWLLGLSILVGIGRVLALVHTPLDIAGGILCAAIAAMLWYRKSLFTAEKPQSNEDTRS
ncbi:MAG TPA: phosphatase PAP2 family protein [Patescibacteria group bacterium]|jgi:membrane-associated phospholipid phosphatase|nr:phosphatase PAP2 family protein [Patescibacteria group bacterium]